ncbi:MAG: ABC transporter ATP-binding protein [Opitutaceae bacterium]|jgi:ABC-2 type transport system ATP-binding protein
MTALDKVSFDIQPGEFFGLLGPNGAGKSTLMSLVSGLRAPDEGSVTLHDRPISPQVADSRLDIGLVPQSPALYRELTAEQNLGIFGRIFGLRGAVLRERIDEALEMAQLTERRHDLVRTFSGGMQRRLNLVAALLHRPKLLLCDEPTVGVDPQARNAIFEQLQKLNSAGMTIVYSTHYMEEAERLCSRIAIIDHGRILALGNLEELLTQLPFEDEISFPAKPETCLLVEKLAGYGELISSGEVHRFRPKPDYPLSAFYTLTEKLGLHARLFESQRPSLENVFLHLTGRKLRE